MTSIPNPTIFYCPKCKKNMLGININIHHMIVHENERIQYLGVDWYDS